MAACKMACHATFSTATERQLHLASSRTRAARSVRANSAYVIPDARSAIRDLDAPERRKVPDSRWRGFRDDGIVFVENSP
jgi:hypothetical protein